MLGIVDGLTEKQIRTAVLPSGWTPVGMLVHVREATRFWLAEILLGDHPTGAGGPIGPYRSWDRQLTPSVCVLEVTVRRCSRTSASLCPKTG